MVGIMNIRWLMIRQLDIQLKEWQLVNAKYSRPKLGWLKTIRMALAMTEEQLASRLGITRPGITQLEIGEMQDSVKLSSLRKAADALDCELVYAIVPKGSSTLESIIKKRAEQIATAEVSRVSHSMSLEAQSVNSNELENQRKARVKSIYENLSKKIWKAQDNPISKAIAKEMSKIKRETK